MIHLTENCLQRQKWSPYRGAASTLVCAKTERNIPASANQGLSIALQDSHHHVHAMTIESLLLVDVVKVVNHCLTF